MRRIGRNYGILASEDVSTVGAEVPAEPAVDSLETELLEVQDSAAEGEAQEQKNDEAVEVAEALEAYATALESIVGNGGLDRNGAAILNIAVMREYKIACLPERRAAMPALESYGQVSGRASTTNLALEEIKAKAAEIWAKLVAQIKRAIEWLLDHYNKVFGSAEKLQKRAQAVAKRAESITGKAKETKIENGALFNKIQVAGSVDQVVAKVQELKDQAKAILVDQVGLNTKIAENFSEIVADPEKNAAGFTVGPVANNGYTKVGEAEGFSAPNGLEIVRSPELPGGRAMIVVQPASTVKGAEALEIFAKTFEKIDAFNPKAKEGSKTTLNVLSNSDVQSVAKGVEDTAEFLQQFRKPIDKIKKSLQDVASKAERLTSQAEKEDKADTKKLFTATQKAAANLVRAVTGGPNSFSVYALNTGKAYLDYCELSLKQYE